VSHTEAASAPDPVPAVPPVPTAPATAPGAFHLDRALLAKVIAQGTQVSAGALAVFYGLGMMVLAGQLRALGLHNTGIISGFKHDDILVKGVGALVSHVPSVVLLALLVGMVLKDRIRAFICDALSPAHRRSPAGRLWSMRQLVGTRVAIATVCGLVLLSSVWWEGTVVVLGLSAYLLVAVRSRTLMVPGVLLATAAVGVLAIGAATTYLNAQPPPDVHILTSDGRTIEGGLLGIGEGGEWYVVKYDEHAGDGDDDGMLQLIPDKQIIDIQIDEPPVTSEPRLYERLTGG
jgi:hypothetical protein